MATPSLSPGIPERAAFAAILVALVAFALIRVAYVDVPWHLATARLALETGRWPVTNTFSWTYPDYPLYQQYPLFQAVLYAAYLVGGWAALSVLHAVLWTAVFLVFVRWAGSFRVAAVLHLPWMVGLLALQRRMVLRPDVLTMLWLGCTLLALDAYRRGRRRWIAVLPLVQLAWVESHQLFTLGLAVQALFLIHLAIARKGWPGSADRSDAKLSLTTPALALGASVAACFLSPLGVGIVRVLGHTAGSLAHHRNHVHEFAFIWKRPLELRLALLCAAAGAWALWRQRRRWVPLELGLWLLSLALALSAVRGLVFFGVVSVAVLQRTLQRQPLVLPSPRVRAALRYAAAALTISTATMVLYYRWIDPPLLLDGTQPGLGRSLGDWPDAGIRFIKESPPPGRMMNLPWALANATIWFAPEVRPFVDPRFESYPRGFLVDAIASYEDDNVLARLIAEYRPAWIFAEHCDDAIRARLVKLVGSGAWQPVHADASTVVLVRLTPESAAYLARHRLGPLPAAPGNLLVQPALRALQQECWDRLRGSLPGAR